jgi:hypothetical protein
MDYTLEELKKISIVDGVVSSSNNPHYPQWGSSIKTADDLAYAYNLQKALSTMQGYDLRVESPWITIYSNDESHIEKLCKVCESKVKYISKPIATLAKDSIVLPKVDFEYRVTLGKTTSNHLTFIAWADTNTKLKLTKSCRNDLSKDRSWGGKYFYITGDNTLLMAKMHLGGCIAKIERIVKQ